LPDLGRGHTFLDKAKITNFTGWGNPQALLLLRKPEDQVTSCGTGANYLETGGGMEQAYEHFRAALLLSTTKVVHRIPQSGYKLFRRISCWTTEVSSTTPG